MYLTGTDGSAYNPYAYDPFGNMLDPTTGKRRRAPENKQRKAYTREGNLIQPFTFTGYREEENGLYYAQARSYDTKAGRFTGEDRIRGIITLPDTINHYIYCLNNPTVYADYNGLWPSWSDIKNGVTSAVEKAENWCDDHKQEIQTAIAVGTVVVAVAATVATCGAAAPSIAAAATTMGCVVAGGCVAAGTATGIDYAMHGGSFVDGFNRGTTNTALTTMAFLSNPVGATIGFGMQLGGDVLSGHMSSMESYTAASWSGAAGLQSGSAAIGGTTYPVVKNTLENYFGVSNHSLSDTYAEAADAYMQGSIFDITFGYHPYTREQQVHDLCTEDACKQAKERGECGQGEKYQGKQYEGLRNPDADFVNAKGVSTLEKHASKHGYISAEEYLKDARRFLLDEPTQTVQSFVSEEGTYFRYDTATNEFGIINQYGGISTYFKPDSGMDYWLEQIELYAPK